MRVAVTGAGGRVGKGVVDFLRQRDHSIVAIDRSAPPDLPTSGVSWVRADTSDYEALLRAFAGCEGVVHLAATPSAGPDHSPSVHNNNVVGSYNALRAAVAVGIERICQASSVNATGAAYSRSPCFDYFPIDEEHPTYAEDPYSLSKWICEIQGDSIARRYETVGIASLRFHLVVTNRDIAVERSLAAPASAIKDLWGYTSMSAAAGACLLSLETDMSGHQAFEIVAPDHTQPLSATELRETHYPHVPFRRPMGDRQGFFDCSKASRLLGWNHDDW